MTISIRIVTATIVTAIGITMSAVPASAKVCKDHGHVGQARYLDLAYRAWMKEVAIHEGREWSHLGLATKKNRYRDNETGKFVVTGYPCITTRIDPKQALESPAIPPFQNFDPERSGDLPIVRKRQVNRLR